MHAMLSFLCILKCKHSYISYTHQNFIGNKRSANKHCEKDKTVVQRPQKVRKLNGYNYFARECLKSQGRLLR